MRLLFAVLRIGSVLVDMVLDPLHDHVQGHQIVATLQNHDVRVLPGGFHVLLVHGLDRGQILVHHGLKGAKILMSNISRRVGFWKIRIPSTMMTLVG